MARQYCLGMGSRGQMQWATINVRALTAITLIVVWGVVLVMTGVFAPSGQTPPSQFDYDGGAVPPIVDDRAIATVQAAGLIASLPVSVVALCIAASSLRVWKEQVTAVVAIGLSSLAALVSIGFAWVGFGTVVFFT